MMTDMTVREFQILRSTLKKPNHLIEIMTGKWKGKKCANQFNKVDIFFTTFNLR
jgi:hypothetical protein